MSACVRVGLLRTMERPFCTLWNAPWLHASSCRDQPLFSVYPLYHPPIYIYIYIYIYVEYIKNTRYVSLQLLASPGTDNKKGERDHIIGANVIWSPPDGILTSSQRWCELPERSE